MSTITRHNRLMDVLSPFLNQHNLHSVVLLSFYLPYTCIVSRWKAFTSLPTKNKSDAVTCTTDSLQSKVFAAEVGMADQHSRSGEKAPEVPIDIFNIKENPCLRSQLPV